MTDRANCQTCNGSGINPERAATPLAMPGFDVYVAAMYPCPDCSEVVDVDTRTQAQKDAAGWVDEQRSAGLWDNS